jgi:hypothetical protein
MGLMRTNADKRRVRLFDLHDFGLLSVSDPKSEGTKDE